MIVPVVEWMVLMVVAVVVVVVAVVVMVVAVVAIVLPSPLRTHRTVACRIHLVMWVGEAIHGLGM